MDRLGDRTLIADKMGSGSGPEFTSPVSNLKLYPYMVPHLNHVLPTCGFHDRFRRRMALVMGLLVFHGIL